ncbi:MAG: FAD-dependent oxidoreductase [Clostridia bacterium]|nr:FAD-dependent oxidoreductase [Clostridia bacterium]
MNYIEEKSRKIPVIASVDVLVAGAGPAGIGAALMAAREGVSVMLLEMEGCLGGVATAGMMSHWGGSSSSKILGEIYDRCEEIQREIEFDMTQKDCGRNTIYHEVQKIALDRMMQDAGVRVLFYTKAVDATVVDGKIVGVTVENKSGRGYIEAKRVVDATGDGDVAAYAGVPYIKGRESDGRMQPATLMFKVGGVAPDGVIPGSFETLVPTEKGELQALAKEILPHPAGHVLLYRNTTPGTVVCNMTNAIEVDGTDAESVTRGLMTRRSQIPHIIKFLREYVPGYENCWLMGSASLLGIRETRHFEGLQTLTKEDILEARLYENWVVRRGHFNFDVHNLTGASLDKTGVQKHFTQKGEYSIPYGCLLPRNVEGLLLSGRNISGSHMAHSNFRIMSVCIAIGEAAGLAAALSIKENVALRDLDVKKIQDKAGI